MLRDSPRQTAARRTLTIVALLLGALVLSGSAGSARSDGQALVGAAGEGDGFSITLVDAAGVAVKNLDPGSYTMTVHDYSTFHNFHLIGPGVDVTTTLDFVGDQTFTFTLKAGTYRFICDPHPQMKGSFTVGTPVAAVTKLAASLSSGSKATLGPLARIAAGKVQLTVSDRSASDSFRLAGKGLLRTSGRAFTGPLVWTLTLRPGTYSFGSVVHPALRKQFTVP